MNVIDRAGRKVLRAVLAAVFLVASLGAPAAAAADRTIRLTPGSGSAPSAAPGTRFRAETEGSPQATLVGGWSEDPSAANEAQLRFAGGHAVGERTTFVGTWLSPVSTSSKNPGMTVDYEVTYANALGEDIPMVQSVRARFEGGKWGSWVKAKTPIAASETSTDAGGIDVVVSLPRARRVQFQWKITGAISAPASVAGDFRLSVN
jgi:hypothetical protein